MSLIKVYHGTSSHYWGKIEDEGLLPQRHRSHVYVTTDYEKAKEYAFIWTGGLIYEEEKNAQEGGYFMMETEGVIFTFEVPEEMLKIDDYNLEGEPNQYKVLGGIAPKYLINAENVFFENIMSDEVTEEEYKSEILRARALLVGVSQWGDD